MTNRIHLFCLSLAALLVSMPPAAMAQAGRSGFSTSRSVGEREYWLALQSFGRCYARSYHEPSFDFLATQPGSAEEAAVYRRLFLTGEVGCLGDMSRMSVVVRYIRGTIAEGLLLQNIAVPPRLALAAPPSVAQIRTLSEVARCYAATHRAEARALIADTSPGSAEELAALEHIEADLFRCVPAVANNLQFHSTDIRYRLAEALLRMPADAAPSRP